ncbi:glycoside hydrolase family 3 protein [bacterium]|nr:glycoside hydrolase family 3 protein [bacterium]
MTLQDSAQSGNVLERLTREQRAGLFVWPSLAGPEISREEKQLLTTFKPSGVVLFRRSLKSLAQTRMLCAEIHELTRASHQPHGAVVAIDEEGGRVYRLPPPFPRNEPAASFASEEREDALRSQVMMQAACARASGIDCLLAPVADILTRQDNPAIADRAFSSEAAVVARCANVVAQEISSAGLLSCAKHFPGHGHTATDSHKGFATTDVDKATLSSREWLPFLSLIRDTKIPMIMTAHVVCTALEPALPATLSRHILNDILRAELGFNGLILSDDLRMNAISDHYGVSKKVTAAIVDDGQNSHDVSDDSFLAKASCDALEAGCDILLSCQSIVREETVLNAVMRHVDEKRNQEEWQAKAERIVALLKKRTTHLA